MGWGEAVSLSSARIGVACVVVVHGSKSIARGDVYVYVYEKKNGSLRCFE